MRRFVLASASTARLRLLTSAGIRPEVIVAGVDEDGVAGVDTAAIVLELARRKATAVATRTDDALVLGCDSLLDVDGVALGKPATAEEAAARWRELRGADGLLLTGHCLIDSGTGAQVADVAATTVRFGCPNDAEIDAYVSTGEPLGVAGAFTLDGLSAPFIDGVVGDPSNVIGLSLPLLRRMLAALDISIVDLWN